MTDSRPGKAEPVVVAGGDQAADRVGAADPDLGTEAGSAAEAGSPAEAGSEAGPSSGAEAGPDAGAGSAVEAGSEEELFQQSEIAADYLEGLLDLLDLDGDIEELVASGRPVVEVVGGELQALVGPRGATLEALQELVRLAVFRQIGAPSRVLLDIGGYRAARRDELAAVARNAVERVREHGVPVQLDSMSAFERKCVHDVINMTEGVVSESEGEEPNRRITVRPG